MALYNDHQISKTTESKRRLFLQKDLFELSQWMDDIEYIHKEIKVLSLIEKQLIKKTELSFKIQSLRRNSTLLMSILCKYEQHIKNEIEYGKNDYDVKRSKEHEKQREYFLEIINQYRCLKNEIYGFLLHFKIR